MPNFAHMKAFLKRPLTIGILGFLVIVVPNFGILLWSFTQPTGTALSSSIEPARKAREKTTFTLRTQNDAIFRKQNLYRHYALAVFDDTSCTTSCAARLKSIIAVATGFKDEIRVMKPLFISIHPTQNTPQLLKTFASPYGPKLIALTGPQNEIDRAKLFFRVQAPIKTGVYLMGPGHKWLGLYTGDMSPQKLSDWMRSYLVKH